MSGPAMLRPPPPCARCHHYHRSDGDRCGFGITDGDAISFRITPCQCPTPPRSAEPCEGFEAWLASDPRCAGLYPPLYNRDRMADCWTEAQRQARAEVRRWVREARAEAERGAREVGWGYGFDVLMRVLGEE